MRTIVLAGLMGIASSAFGVSGSKISWWIIFSQPTPPAS